MRPNIRTAACVNCRARWRVDRIRACVENSVKKYHEPRGTVANRGQHYAYVDEGPPPRVGEHWARRFLERHPEYLVHNQSKRSTERKHKTSIPSSGGFMSSRESAMSAEYSNGRPRAPNYSTHYPLT